MVYVWTTKYIWIIYVSLLVIQHQSNVYEIFYYVDDMDVSINAWCKAMDYNNPKVLFHYPLQAADSKAWLRISFILKFPSALYLYSYGEIKVAEIELSFQNIFGYTASYKFD